MTIAYIKQKTSWDCGICAIAMACGIDYADAAADLIPAATPDKGINGTLVHEWLFKNGWAWQEVTRNVFRHGQYEPTEPWPPAPFAPVHLVEVEATAGHHYCVMDRSGRVYDPFKEDRHSLDHPDYKRVFVVTGLFKLPAFFACPDCGKDCADDTEPHALDCERAARRDGE